ncbi:hypothetical protein GWK91_05065 [Virgibacillus sp. MSP4-1]|uniref:hypothetical protein n=1 Tax=Virgibacillus sp. MSP4-1 TaxID=2700081 RepID=UPI0003A388D8|nr:hypothetical protein [Virgibacillus sp. MSP4-1]QHS22359.1 hypothetical protein GWK91_05065 [Virgibacillus sp. MSP4-1]
MAFGVKRAEVNKWKQDVKDGKIAFITHYWLDDRFPDSRTVTKAGCNDLEKLQAWGKKYGLKPEWIHQDEEFPHFDLIGKFQKDILKAENQIEQIHRFKL